MGSRLTNGLVVVYIEGNFNEDSEETPRVQVQGPSAAPPPRKHVTVFDCCTVLPVVFRTVSSLSQEMARQFWGALHAKVIQHIKNIGVSSLPCRKSNLKTADLDISMIPLLLRARVISSINRSV
jgi:hypothetical protein